MIDVDRIKQDFSVSELAKNAGNLRRAGPNELCGPCPLCGGDDRFHCTDEWFFCRVCRPKRGDVIDYVAWSRNLGFLEAVGQLTSLPASPEPSDAPVRSCPRPLTQKPIEPISWQPAPLESSPGASYLEGRGLGLRFVWRDYDLGYCPERNAIGMPWFHGGKLSGVRFRFLGEGRLRLVSLPGSRFSGLLYGGQAITMGNENLKTLILCEGEINAMSIYQEGANIEVLSFGSETARLTNAMVSHAAKYKHVLVWMDKECVVSRIRSEIPWAWGVSSEKFGGMDANDLLQKGALDTVLDEITDKMLQGIAVKKGGKLCNIR